MLTYAVNSKVSVQRIINTQAIVMPLLLPHEFNMGLRINDILKQQNRTQSWLAEEVGVSRPHVSQIISGARAPSLLMIESIARVLGVEIGALFSPQTPIPVAGLVGAGGAVELVDSYAKGDGLYRIYASDLPTRAAHVAVEVRGDSMAPIIQEGDVLIFSRTFDAVDPEAVNKIAVLCTTESEAMVKHLREGREDGTFDLYSANNLHAPIYNKHLLWATPLVRHIPKRDVMIA